MIYRHTVRVTKTTNTQTNTGTFDPDYSDRITSLQCLLQHKKVTTSPAFGRLANDAVVMMFCDYTSETEAISDEDRIEVESGDNNTSFVGSYEVLGIVDAGGQQHHLEIEMQVIR